MHCGPGALFVSCLGGGDEEGPGGVALLDQNTFEVTGQWEADRGDQYLAYDVWWHVMHDVAITSEWGTPSMIEDGIVPELLLGQQVRAPAALLGHEDPDQRADGRPGRRSTRWRWSCARPTTRPSCTASSAW